MAAATIYPERSSAAPLDDPLTANHRAELATARERSKKISKAARVASFNGWSTALMAAGSSLFALFDVTSAVITIALIVIAYNEFRGRRRLLEFDPSAATFLGGNQLGLLSMIVAYCAWTLYTSLHGGSADIAAQMKGFADVDAALGSVGGFDALYKLVALSLYGGVIVLSVLFQGGNALYYFSRRRHIEAFVAETPAWARDLLRESR